MHRRKIAFAAAIATSVVMVFGSAAVTASSAVLRKESEGSKVVSFQKDLIKLGYLSSDATGYYGELTETAVKKVQREYGYEADGIAGAKTLSLIDRLLGRDKAAAVSSNLMKEGDESSSVTALQKNLIKLGYLDTKATGYFGPATKDAVLRLQKKHGYMADGIAGKATLGLIGKLVSGVKETTAAKAAVAAVPAGKDETAAEKTAKAGTAVAAATFGESAGSADSNLKEASDAAESAEKAKTLDDYLRKWYGNVEDVFDRGETAEVYDIRTGKSFKIKRTYGTNHADCETLTKEDTAIMKAIYSGTWSWERRPIIVKVDGLEIAASMTGYPHAGMDKYAANKTISSRSGGYGRGTNLDAVKNNNMNGVFDIHFLGSKNHYNNKIDPKHQTLVKEAGKWAMNRQ